MTMQQLSNPPCQAIRANRWLYAAGISLVIYGIIELADCLTLVAMQAGWVGNPYTTFLPESLTRLMDEQPLVLLPMFAAFTGLRWLAAVGILGNRLWGFWIGLAVTAATIVWLPDLLPMGSIEMLISAFILALLIIGICGEKALVTAAPE